MKELYVEGLASHNSHESCAGHRKATREAFDSGTRRLGIEPRKSANPSADTVMYAGRQHGGCRYARHPKAWRGRRPQKGTAKGRQRPLHARKLFAWEPGEPRIDRENKCAVRVGNPIGASR